MQILVQSVSQKREEKTDLGQIQHPPFKYRLPLNANSIVFVFFFRKAQKSKYSQMNQGQTIDKTLLKNQQVKL